eukprot:16464-Eustigmatos_ZCMA.PRE.1
MRGGLGPIHVRTLSASYQPFVSMTSPRTYLPIGLPTYLNGLDAVLDGREARQVALQRCV